MSTGLNIRAVQSTPTAPVRQELAPERQVARTELPETQVVLSAADSQRIEPGLDDRTRNIRAGLNAVIDNQQSESVKKVDRDAATQELVFRTVSAETGRVVSQFPDEAVLRQRAYSQQQQNAELNEKLNARVGSEAESQPIIRQTGRIV
ncbi:MAG: hypothetical protein ACKVON_13000 [Beijerinckiaceae bacterium]